MDSKEATELLKQAMRENQRQHAERLAQIAREKAAAPNGKEPIDLGTMKRLATTDALGLNDEELLFKLEDIYYIQKPELMTMKELAAVVERLIFY